MNRQILRASVPLLLLLCQLTSPASALEIDGQSRTYLQSREQTDSTKVFPLYEYLDFRADGLGTETLSFHAGGWYRYSLQNEDFGAKKTGDLQYAYLSIKRNTANAYVNLGRIVTNQGAASSQFDGASAGADLKWGFGISAFGGLPVETAFDTRTGDSVYGGRLSQGREGLYRIGVSYLEEKNDNKAYRKEEGADLWFRPFDKVELLGTAQYNALTSSCARRNAYLTLGAFGPLTLRTEYTEISYKDYFTSSTLSAFQLQTGGPVDPTEKLKTAGEEAVLAFGPVSLSADYKKYQYHIAGNADYFGGRLGYSAQNAGAHLSAHRMDGKTDKLRYDEYRVYGYKKFSTINVSADLLATRYVVAINGVKDAYSASLAAGYALTARTQLGADVEYAKNPYFDKDVRGLVKLVYNFDFAPGAAGRK
jgi:hypothetical protein